MNSELESKLREILSAVLELDPKIIGAAFCSEDCAAWDSVKHLSIVLSVEDQFGVMFDDDEIAKLNSLPALRRALSGKLP